MTLRLSTGPTKSAPSSTESTSVVLSKDGVSSTLTHLLGVQDPGMQADQFSDMYLEGADLDIKIKEKIWEGTYVELGTLIPKPDLPPRLNMSKYNNDNSQIQFTPQKARMPANIGEWRQWFGVFQAVYCERHEGAGAMLSSYANRIAEMVVDYPNTFVWRQYDILFRKRKAKYYDLRWEIVYSQVLRSAQHLDIEAANHYRGLKVKNASRGRGRGRGTFSGNNNANARSQSNRKGTCNLYNNGNPCTFSPCRFLHACSSCRGSHPQYQCEQSSTNQN